jgi:ribosomal protein L37AE/L43A
LLSALAKRLLRSCGGRPNISHTLLSRDTHACSCNACCDREFARKKIFQCPRCKKDVKRSALTEKTIDELSVAREIPNRRRILKM